MCRNDFYEYIFAAFSPIVVIIKDRPRGGEQEDRLQSGHPQPGGEEAPRQRAEEILLHLLFNVLIFIGYFTLFRKAC